ncbi:MAG: hypothetical protein JKP95_03650 [Oceanicaulis sp.]|nr:hypothetical protein [Oceanicaulis sp.]
MKAAKRAFTAAALSLGLAASAMAQSSVIELERTASGYFVAPVFIGPDGPYPFAPDTAPATPPSPRAWRKRTASSARKTGWTRSKP